MSARDDERGRLAICGLFASSRSTGVVYGVADPGVTGLRDVTVEVFGLWPCCHSV
jgi:hypothetical protein